MKIFGSIAAVAAIAYSALVYVFILDDEKKLKGGEHVLSACPVSDQFISSVDPVVFIAVCAGIIMTLAVFAYLCRRMND